MQLNHYLIFNGEAEIAFKFYQSIFGGQLQDLQRYGDAEWPDGTSFTEQERHQVLHVALAITPQLVLMGSDFVKACAPAQPTGLIMGNNHYVSINLQGDDVEARRLFNQLSVQGHIETQLGKTFWGALYGAFTDQFGVRWMINCQQDSVGMAGLAGANH